MAIRRSTVLDRGWLKLLLLAADYGVVYLLVLIGFRAAGAVQGVTGNSFSTAEDPLLLWLAPIAWVIFLGFEGLYQQRVLLSILTQGKRLSKVSLEGIMFMVFIIYVFRVRSSIVHREAAFSVSLAVWTGLGIWRLLVVRRFLRKIHRRYVEGRRMVIVGSDEKATRLATRLSGLERYRPRIVGFVDDRDSLARSSINGGRLLGELEVLPKLCNAGGVDEILIAKNDMGPEKLVELSEACAAAGVRVKIVSSVLNVFLGRASVDKIDGMPIVEVGQSRLRGGWRTVKRVFDLVGASAILVLISPLLFVIALGIKLTSPGPVLYRQKRIGKRGNEFVFYKFRTMIDGNGDSTHREYVRRFVTEGGEAALDSNGRKVYKVTNDDRVTRFGRFLRKTSLDELPQLINVLRGEMSLVGPRPCLPYEWDLYKPWQRKRLAVTPGMTGLWQVTGRSSVSFEDMVLLDLHYIANWSFTWDLSLILQTVPVVALGKGGH